MFHRKPVLFIHAVTNADGRRIAENFYGTTMVKPSANALKLDAPRLFVMAMPPLQSSTGILPRYAVIMGRLNARQAAKPVWAKIPNRMADRSCPLLRSAKTGVGRAVAYSGWQMNVAPVKSAQVS
ncbi:hypothetical protein KCP74_18505 [Salmonella enterica subsp. enterica]|nr:hypothetical protein KCP74_18505 [Salmonella enterica subsp. enterica]